MSDAERHPSRDSPSNPIRLPSPGCLLSVAMLVIAAGVGLWILKWRHQSAQVEFFEHVARDVETTPSLPAWMYDYVVPEDESDNFRTITRIDLRGSSVTDAGLVHLSGFTELRDLRLRSTQVTDAGLRHLQSLTSLEELSLSDTRITGSGLQHLSRLVNLNKLYLRNTAVSDAGLQYLSELPDLEWLFLENTQVTDDGLHHLYGLTRLKWVDLEGTRVTEGGAEELRARLPEAEVVR